MSIKRNEVAKKQQTCFKLPQLDYLKQIITLSLEGSETLELNDKPISVRSYWKKSQKKTLFTFLI